MAVIVAVSGLIEEEVIITSVEVLVRLTATETTRERINNHTAEEEITRLMEDMMTDRITSPTTDQPTGLMIDKTTEIIEEATHQALIEIIVTMASLICLKKGDQNFSPRRMMNLRARQIDSSATIRLNVEATLDLGIITGRVLTHERPNRELKIGALLTR